MIRSSLYHKGPAHTTDALAPFLRRIHTQKRCSGTINSLFAFPEGSRS